MKRFIFILAFLPVLFLSACGGDDELKQGIDAYNSGDYETAYDFFKKKAKEAPDKDASEWLKKTKKAYSKVVIKEVNKAYENRNLEKANKLVKIALELEPSNEQIIEAASKVEIEFEEQKDFDVYTSFLNKNKIQLTNLTDSWNLSFAQMQAKQITYEQFLAQAKNIYPQLTKIRVETEEIGYKLEVPLYKEVNDSLFNYVWVLETQISSVLLGGAQSISELANDTSSFQPDVRKEVFDSIKSNIDSYVNEPDMEGNKIRNLKNTLDF